jgi:amidohydrolase
MDRLWDKITELRHELHRHPELSGAEKETKARLMAFIQKYTNLKIVDMGNWFYALYEPAMQTEKSAIAFRADMDALPVPETISLPYGSEKANVAHKCGHDGHSAALAALAILLEEDPNVRRPVYLIFQSAEETGRGGKSCADFLKGTQVREVYAFHNLSGYPEGAVMVRDLLTQCASKGLLVKFQGERAHAGTPEDGRNPSAALAELALCAQQLQDEPASRLCTVVSIQEGSLDFGISPGDGEIAFTLRTESDEELSGMDKTLRQHAEQLAERYGLDVDFSEYDPFPATVNDPRCAEKVRQAASELGLTQVPMEQPWRPSEDFGWYTKVCPGAMFYIGNGDNWPMPHQPGFDFNDHILRIAASVFLKLAENS